MVTTPYWFGNAAAQSVFLRVPSLLCRIAQLEMMLDHNACRAASRFADRGRKCMSWRHDRKMGGRVNNSIVE
jgi:hypothetical protein